MSLNFSVLKHFICQLTTNFLAKNPLTTVFLAKYQLTANPIGTLLFFFVCKLRVSAMLSFIHEHEKAQKSTLIEGSLQFARNHPDIILAEQTSRPPKKAVPKRNCPSAVFFVGSTHFCCKRSTNVDSCFLVKEGDSVFCSH